MKNFFTLLFCGFLYLAKAQAPQSISYQGVARNASGTVLSNQSIAVKFDLHQGSVAGSIVFNEIHNATTNSFGLFTLLIGTVNTSGFTTIAWDSGPYFLEVSMDPTGGASFVSVGNQQLLSVPYALYAEKAGNASPTPTIAINSPNTVTNPSAGVYNINVPSTTTYTAGNGIDLTGNIITNTAPAITPTLTVTGNSISINPGNTQSLPTYSLTQSGSNIDLLQNGTSVATVTLTPGTSYVAGSGISVTSGTITNTAPDQTVTITGTGVTGAYPNFTITPVATPSTTLVQGNNVVLNQSGNTYTVAGVTPTLNVIGGSLTGAYPSQTLTVNNPTTSIISTNNAVLNVTQTGNSYTLSPSTQTLTGSASSFSISNGNSIPWPNHTLSLTTNTLSINGPGGNSVVLPANPTTTITQGANITVGGTAPNYIISAPNYVLGTSSNSITLTNGANTSSVAVPIQSLALTGTTLSAGPTTNSVNLASLPSNWTLTSGVIYPTTLSNSVGIGTSGPLTDKMEINHASSSTNTHLHLKQTGADAFSRIKFSNAVAPTKYWINSVTSDASDANSGFNVFYHNGTIGRNLFTVAGNGKVSVNPFSMSYPTLFEVNGGIELDSTIAVNGLNNMPPASVFNGGKIYFDRPTQRFMVSENNGPYKPLFGTGPWTQAAGSVTLTNNGDKVGVGVFNPTSKLDIAETFSVNGGQAVNIAAVSSSTIGANSAIYSDILGQSVANYVSGYFRSGMAVGATGNATGVKGFAVGSSAAAGNAVGVDGNGQGANQNYGVSAIAIGTTGVTNYGVYTEASGVGSNYALFAVANATVGNNYAAYLRGNTYAEGKFALGAITTTPTPIINQGSFYYDDVADKIMVAENGAAYKPLFGPESWTQSPGRVTLTNIGDKVGIGTGTPGSKLTIIETATMSAINVNNSGSGEAINAIGGTGRSIYASTNAGGMSTIETTNLNSGYALTALKSYSMGGVVSISNSSATNGFEPLYVSTAGTGAAIRAVAGAAAASALALHIDNGHIKSTGATPAFTSTVATLQTYTLTGTDVAGKISVLTSTLTAVPAGAEVIQVTFNKPYAAGTVPTVILTPTTPNIFAVQAYVSGVTNTGFRIKFNNASALSSTYAFNYFVIE